MRAERPSLAKGVPLFLEVFLWGEGILCEQRVPSPHTPHPPKNFSCSGASRRGMQRVTRLQVSQNLNRKANGDVFSSSPGDVTERGCLAGSRYRRVTRAKVLGRERGSARGRRKPFWKTVFLSPSPKTPESGCFWKFFCGGKGPFVNKGSLTPTHPIPRKTLLVLASAVAVCSVSQIASQPESKQKGKWGCFFLFTGGRNRLGLSCRGTIS